MDYKRRSQLDDLSVFMVFIAIIDGLFLLNIKSLFGAAKRTSSFVKNFIYTNFILSELSKFTRNS